MTTAHIAVTIIDMTVFFKMLAPCLWM